MLTMEIDSNITEKSQLCNQNGRRWTDLPDDIIFQICGHLGTNDLLMTAQTCRILAIQSARRLYNKIIISNDRQLVRDTLTCTKLHQKKNNSGTLIHSSRLLHLLSVIKENERIAAYVKVIVFLDDWELYTNFHIVRVYLETLLQNVLQLDGIVFPRDVSTNLSSISSLSQYSQCFQNLKVLVLTVGNEEVLEPIVLPALESLKLLYTTMSSLVLFSLLSFSLGAGQSLENLRRLSIERLTGNSGNSDDISSVFNSLSLGNRTETPVWFLFFEILAQSQFQLQLDFLSIDRAWFDRLELNTIELAIGFQRLQKIRIGFQNFHNHHDCEAIGKMNNLKMLIVDDFPSCTKCQEVFLQWLKSCTLKSLKISGQIPSDFFRSLAVIQPQLETLDVFDSVTQDQNYRMLSKCLNNRMCVLNYELGSKVQHALERVFFADRFADNTPDLINDYLEFFYQETAHQGLNHFLKCYLNLAFSPVVSSELHLQDFPSLRNIKTLNLKLRIVREGRFLTLYHISAEKLLPL